VIREYLYLVYRPFRVPLPVFEGIHYCEELLVVDFVVYFRGLEYSGVEGYWVKPSFIVSLG